MIDPEGGRDEQPSQLHEERVGYPEGAHRRPQVGFTSEHGAFAQAEELVKQNGQLERADLYQKTQVQAVLDTVQSGQAMKEEVFEQR